jgi:glycerol-3-phosphate dehydrogenase
VRARARVYIDAPVLHAVRVPADRLTTVVVRDSASAALTEVRCETVVNCAGARGCALGLITRAENGRCHVRRRCGNAWPTASPGEHTQYP